MSSSSMIGRGARTVPFLGNALTVKDLVKPSAPSGPQLMPGYPPPRRRRGWIVVVVVLLTALLANGLHLFGLNITWMPSFFGTTQTVSTPQMIVLGPLQLDGKYDVLRRFVQFPDTIHLCRDGVPDSCRDGTLTVNAQGVYTASVQPGTDYTVKTTYNKPANANQIGDATLDITLYVTPLIANPKTDVNILYPFDNYQEGSSTFAWMGFTQIDQLKLMNQAWTDAVKFLSVDNDALVASKAELAKMISDQATSWGATFGYVVHPHVTYGVRPNGP